MTRLYIHNCMSACARSCCDLVPTLMSSCGFHCRGPEVF